VIGTLRFIILLAASLMFPWFIAIPVTVASYFWPPIGVVASTVLLWAAFEAALDRGPAEAFLARAVVIALVTVCGAVM
jgi:hypothetical protein